MNIGLDIHGVIDKYPTIFKFVCKFCKVFGVKVFVITGPPEKVAHRELWKLGFIYGKDYQKVLSVVDWLKENTDRDKMYQDKNGDWWSTEDNWWSSKAYMCIENNVDVHVDDSERYLFGWEKTKCQTLFFLLKNDMIKRKRNEKSCKQALFNEKKN